MTLEDMGIPSLIVHDAEVGLDVRATRIRVPGLELAAELWVGGSHSAVGEPVRAEDLREAWVVDCAGALPPELGRSARLLIPRVFEDIEQVPPAYAQLDALAARLAHVLGGAALGGAILDGAILDGADGHASPSLPADPPARLYVMCKQGFNRSALVAGRVLRGLGVPGDEAVRALRAHRPGAVANLAFERLILR